ncbi:MAG: bifunctional phosphoglucose/phosphomannose isomerase [Patescibacteria group bacterium]
MLNLELDKHKMIVDLKNYSQQIKATLADLVKFNPEIGSFENIVFCGMGGSAIGGDLIRACFENEIEIPMLVCRDYVLPRFVDPETLVIVCSFSGNTEETLACLNDAKKLGAKILTISSGGEIEAESLKNKIPFFKLNYQSECDQPRVNSGVMLTTVAVILAKLNLIDLDKNIWERIIENIDGVSADCADENEAENLAFEIAQKLQNKIPVFHGAGFLSTVARRFKQDVNETSKQFAFYEEVPESNHNATVGYEFPEAKKDLIMVSLESSLDYPRNEIRWEILKQIWDKRGLEQLAIMTDFETKLEQVFHLVYLGMWVSYYLGILNKIDPTPVEAIKFLKDGLAKS